MAKRSYGYHPSNPKIDLYVNGQYVGSTNWATSLKQAVNKYVERNPNATNVTAHYDRSR